jgi:hypothetical protein
VTNPTLEYLVNVEELTELSSFTIKPDGSKDKKFDLASLYFGLVATVPGKLISLPFEGDVRFLAYDSDGKLITSIDQLFIPKLSPPTLNNILPVNMDKVDFGSKFNGVSSVKVRLLDARIPLLVNLGQFAEIFVAMEFDTFDVTTYPK